MGSIRLNLLGTFEASEVSGGAILLPTRKSEALLAYLAMAPGRTHPRETLYNLLWSDRSEAQARNSLRHALSALKKALSDVHPAPLNIEQTAVTVAPNTVEVDTLEFEELAGQGQPGALKRAAGAL